MSDIWIPIAVGVAVLFLIIGLNKLIFGDQTKQDSFKPLWIIIPIMVAIVWYLISKF